jgi:hypothetical protein
MITILPSRREWFVIFGGFLVCRFARRHSSPRTLSSGTNNCPDDGCAQLVSGFSSNDLGTNLFSDGGCSQSLSGSFSDEHKMHSCSDNPWIFRVGNETLSDSRPYDYT